jgi:hypothetical protein
VKKNQQLAQLLLEIHEQWARDNGYRDKQQASSVKHKGSSAKPQASSSLIMEPGKSFTDL